jgi:hypothetical protein
MKTIKLKSILALILFSILTFGLASLATAQNDFSADGNAVALWSVDNGTLTTDSIGKNTLADNNTVGTDTVDYKEGDASASFLAANSQSLTILDSALDSGFPLKSGESNDDISVTFWYKKESNNSYAGLFSKWDTGAGARSFYLRDNSTKLDFYIGTNSGTGYELLNSSLSTSAGRWYHVGATFNNTTKAWKLRVWDDTAGSVVLNVSGTAANNIAITSAAVAIGASLKSGSTERYFDGLIDDVVVFRDILTTGEIDQIRSGTYSGPAPTTTTTLAPTTTTTTLAPTTTTTTLAPTTTTTTTTTTTLPPGDYPTLSSATLGTDGTTLTLVFNQSVDIGVGGSGGFDIDVSDSTQNIACTYSSGSGSTTLIYTAGQALWSGATLNLDYAQPGDGVEATDDGFDVLTFADASITNSSTATTTTTTTLPPAGTNISSNGFDDSFPKTAGGYVVWQGKAGNDSEIFLYNANNGSGPVQITDNDYGDVKPETDGRYVTWASGAAPNGEIFLYDIENGETERLTEIWDTDPTIMNKKYDHDPKIVDGVVVWVSHNEGVAPSEGVEGMLYGPGDIWLYNAVDGYYENISRQIDPNNEHDDYAFRFDGNRIQWVQNTSGDMTTNKYYRYYIPDDEDLDFDAEYYVEDLTAGTAYIQTDSPAVLVDQQSDGDFFVEAMWINGDREILLNDRQGKSGRFLTNNNINDIQPAIKDNIVVWTGGEGNNSEIYLYKIKVIATTQGIAALIDQFISSGDISDPGKLYDYLLTAQGYIDSGDYDNAIKKGLENFKKELDTLKDKKGVVSEAAFVVLAGAANEMIVELSGGAPPI